MREHNITYFFKHNQLYAAKECGRRKTHNEDDRGGRPARMRVSIRATSDSARFSTGGGAAAAASIRLVILILCS